MNKTSKKHSCRKNWSGSSKGMESFLTINGLTTLKKKGFEVKRIIMDDDTTTFSRAKKSISPELIKGSDKNHVIKNMTNELYKLKPRHRSLTGKVISYLKKCVTYAVSQNHGNTTGVKSNMAAIVPHTFGNHDTCNPAWCRNFAEGENYRHSSLPLGKDLNNEELKHDLEALFTKFCTDNMSEKLANLGSSNINENMNNIIARKAPKASHFSGSESLDFRVSAAVAQKNEGHSYILQVYIHV